MLRRLVEESMAKSVSRQQLNAARQRTRHRADVRDLTRAIGNIRKAWLALIELHEGTTLSTRAGLADTVLQAIGDLERWTNQLPGLRDGLARQHGIKPTEYEDLEV